MYSITAIEYIFFSYETFKILFFFMIDVFRAFLACKP